MLFSSMALVFLFLPIVCALYAMARWETQNYILLIASILFYAWGEPRYVAVMLLTILISYLGGLLVSQSRYRRTVLLLTILGDLSFLSYFKYFNLLAENINAPVDGHINFIKAVVLIGISFYTLRVPRLCDRCVPRRDRGAAQCPQACTLHHPVSTACGETCLKYHDVADQIDGRTMDFDKVACGVKRFIVGLAKKILIANTLGAVADKVFTQPVVRLDCITANILN